MKFIILAAGKGSRLKNSLPSGYPYITKSIIRIDGKPFINYLIEKISQFTNEKITVVIGHEYQIVNKLLPLDKASPIINKLYEKDSNLSSLYLALESLYKEKNKLTNGVIIIEADSYFSIKEMENFIIFLNKINQKKLGSNLICWTSKGVAKSDDSGGFLDIKNKKKKDGEVTKAYISSKKNNLNTLKMFGITWLSKQSSFLWYKNAKLFFQENDKNHLKYYFHNIIFNNQKEFSMKYYDFGDKALSFNTYEDYLLCLKDYKQNKVLKNSTTTKNESIFNQSK